MSRKLIALLALPLLAGGCTPDDPPAPLSSPTVEPVSGPVAFRVHLGAGERLTRRSPNPNADGCPAVDVVVVFGSSGRIRLAAYGSACTNTDDNDRPGNGYHGVYRTAEDIPADRRATAVTIATGLGPATVFTQPYFECTNSCQHYTESVAVITLDRPADPAFPTLTAYAENGKIGPDRFATVLREQLTLA